MVARPRGKWITAQQACCVRGSQRRAATSSEAQTHTAEPHRAMDWLVRKPSSKERANELRENSMGARTAGGRRGQGAGMGAQQGKGGCHSQTPARHLALWCKEAPPWLAHMLAPVRQVTVR